MHAHIVHVLATTTKRASKQLHVLAKHPVHTVASSCTPTKLCFDGVLQMEAAADKQLAGMLAQRRGSRDGASSSSPAAAGSAPGSASASRRTSGNGGGTVGFGAAAAAVAAFSSLKQAMGLPEVPAGVVPER